MLREVVRLEDVVPRGALADGGRRVADFEGVPRVVDRPVPGRPRVEVAVPPGGSAAAVLRGRLGVVASSVGSSEPGARVAPSGAASVPTGLFPPPAADTLVPEPLLSSSANGASTRPAAPNPTPTAAAAKTAQTPTRASRLFTRPSVHGARLRRP
jgi:hypothetical protein